MRKFIYTFLSLFLIFAPAYAYATTSVGGWTATDSLIAGANTTINATKTAGGKVLNSAVTVGASAAKVGKHLIKGGGQAALAYAMVELLEEGIDWVLDPANNAVKYKDKPSGDGYIYTPIEFVPAGGVTKFNSISAICASAAAYYSKVGYCKVINGNTVYMYSDSAYQQPYRAIGTRSGFENPDDDWKYIPIETVAAKVISNAELGHAPSQEAVKATALEGFAAGDYDAALDAAATEVGTENPPDTTNPDNPAPTDPTSPFQLPAFCSWAAPVCTFIDWSKQQWLSFTLTFTALKDWLFEEPPPEKDNTIDTPVLPITSVQVAINFVGSCPAPLTFEYKIYNQTFTPSVPFTPMCEVAVMINPVIKICATIAAIYIVAGIRQGS